MGLCKPHYDAATRGIPTGRVSTKLAAEHISALRRAGLGTPRISELSGIPGITIWRIPKRQKMLAGVAASILAVPVPGGPMDMTMDGAYIPITGSRRRLRALQALGYPLPDLSARIGATRDALGDIASGQNTCVTAGVARRIEQAFRELQLTPGPSNITRIRSSKKGWYLPLAWDEDTIDDPDARPDTGTTSKFDWLGEYKELREFGLSDLHAAERMGTTVEALHLRLRRLNAA